MRGIVLRLTTYELFQIKKKHVNINKRKDLTERCNKVQIALGGKNNGTLAITVGVFVRFAARAGF